VYFVKKFHFDRLANGSERETCVFRSLATLRRFACSAKATKPRAVILQPDIRKRRFVRRDSVKQELRKTRVPSRDASRAKHSRDSNRRTMLNRNRFACSVCAVFVAILLSICANDVINIYQFHYRDDSIKRSDDSSPLSACLLAF